MKPLWISHRGFAHSAVENTIDAFRAAIDLGFTALETDLRLTRDGHIVLHHDIYLTRITGCRAAVAAKNRAEIEHLHPKLTFFDELWPNFLHSSWTFDIKRETADGVIDQLMGFAQAGDLVANKLATARYVTWGHKHEARIRRLFPNATFYANERECWRAGLAVIAQLHHIGGIVAGRSYAVPARLGRRQLFNKNLVSAYHQRGARITAFLPETDADANDALEAGFDEILTNGRILVVR